MSLQVAAQHLKAQGRGSDDQLVHMSSSEVKNLQDLAKAHGGELSTNPNTGLPEAGFLEDILPTVVGVGLDMFAPGLGEAVGGAFGLSGAMGTGLLTGGLGALMTGDLGKGLMAGLGAYGGANLAEGVLGAGKGLDADALAKRVQELAVAPTQDGGMSAYTQALGSGTQTTAENLGNYWDKMATEAPTQLQTAVPETKTPWQYAQAGLGQIANAPGQFLQDNWKNIGMAAAPVLAGLANKQPTVPGTEKYSGPLSKYSLSPDFKGSTPVRPNPYYQAQYPNYVANPYNPVMMADGGLAGSEQGTMYPQSQQDHTQFATPTQMPTSAQVVAAGYEPQTNPFSGQETVAGFAAGGTPDVGIFRDTDPTTSKQDALQATMTQLNKRNKAVGLKAIPLPKARMDSLGDMSDISNHAAGGSIGGYSDGGRMLKGPGDGMSDSIPATIGKRQPARLADGEFVVPADVVSHLGNGSTDAGARKLYGMMDNIRKARTGKKKQAPAVKADKYIPS